MSSKIFILGLFIFGAVFTSNAQRIVVDSTSTSRYLISEDENVDQPNTNDELSFGDRALSIGKGILNRLKARLNLEEAAESIKGKGEKFLGKTEEENENRDDDSD